MSRHARHPRSHPANLWITTLPTVPAPHHCGTCGNIHHGRCPTRTTRYHGQATTRASWQPLIETGTIPCHRDPTHTIDPTQPWDLDHTDTGDRLPSCRRHNIAATRSIND